MDYLFIRHHIYDLLRRIFMEEPSVDFLNFLQKNNILDIVKSQLNENPKIPNLYQSCIDELSSKNIYQTSNDYQILHWDFTQLFIGPHILPASPWESSYKNNKLIFTETTYEVEQYYRKYGFNLPKNEIEAADHIGFELDFIFHLSEMSFSKMTSEMTVLKDNLDAQNNFLQTHLLDFVENLTTKIIQHALTNFYKNIALFTAEFIRFDTEKISSILLKIQKIHN